MTERFHASMLRRPVVVLGAVGVVMLVAGLAALVIGLVLMPAEVAGTTSSGDAGAAPAYAGTCLQSVDGRGWLIAGTVAVACGGIALAATLALRSRRRS